MTHVLVQHKHGIHTSDPIQAFSGFMGDKDGYIQYIYDHYCWEGTSSIMSNQTDPDPVASTPNISGKTNTHTHTQSHTLPHNEKEYISTVYIPLTVIELTAIYLDYSMLGVELRAKLVLAYPLYLKLTNGTVCMCMYMYMCMFVSIL